jgi:adenylate cyclase
VLGLAVIVLLPFGLQYWGVDTQGLPAFGGLIGWTMAYSAAAALARMFGSEERRFAQGALGRYLPRDVAAAILRDPGQLSLHGERTTIFALFSDLEGFTKLTHAVPPETTALLLNSYLDRLSGIVLAHGGTVDKFVGDAVVAFWGAPIARPDDGDRALAAAIAMVEAGEAFKKDPPAACPPIGRTRVGLHRGEAIVGNFGGEGRMQYTALGDAMNTASRLEDANKKLGTRALVSAEAVAGMTDPPLRPMGRITVRGRSTPIEVFEPVSGVSDDELHLFRKMLRNFDTGESGALEELERYAEARDGDQALGKLVENLQRIGPGGCLALD